jgi:hypothetical protein
MKVEGWLEPHFVPKMESMEELAVEADCQPKVPLSGDFLAKPILI